MYFAELVMPDAVRNEATQILSDIEQSTGVLEMSQAAGIAEGFARGLAYGQAMEPGALDTLELMFSGAVGRRMAALRG